MARQPPSQAFLRSPISQGYRPRVYGFYYDYNDPRPFFRLIDVERMRRDGKIGLGLTTLRGPVRLARWNVRSDDPRVSRFVDAMYRRVWKRSLGCVLKQLEYGYVPGEWRYVVQNGLLVIHSLIDFYPLDANPLELRGEQVGLALKLPSGGEARIGSPRFFWGVHRPEMDRYRGMSRLAQAWVPWMEKTGRHGALETRRLWFLKNATRGDVIRHPPGTTRLADGTIVSYQDEARQIVEKIENGGVLAFDNTRDETGEYNWSIDRPQITGNAEQILQYPKNLDVEMLEAMGIPPEVIQTTGDSGSGYRGRSIPAQAFYTSEDEIVDAIFDQVDRSAVWPLVRANFGNARYEVEPIPLLDEVPVGEGKPSTELAGNDQPESVRMSLALRVAEQAKANLAKARRPVMLSLTAGESHKFSSTQFNLPSELADEVRRLGDRINVDDLAADGLEAEPHVTIKYGLHDDDAAKVQELVRGFGPVRMTVGPMTLFPAVPGDDGGVDVLKLNVSGEDLHRFNSLIASRVDCTDTHPTYQPHITVAYLKARRGDRYVGIHPLVGREISLDRFVFSDRDGKRTTIEIAPPVSLLTVASALPAIVDGGPLANPTG